jgi:alkylhydroperoxidase/carboxymuconolactone decarboxylase family protein YurZ
MTESQVQLPEVDIPANLSDWYQEKFFRHAVLEKLTPKFLSHSIRHPAIFSILKNRPGFQFAAQDAWRRTMWRKGGLSRSNREAIAVAVSIANSCQY